MKHVFISGLIACLLSPAASAAAGPAETLRTVISTLTDNPGKSVIHGMVLDGKAIPLPHARVRLRNLQTRHIEQESITDNAGEFVFVAQPAFPYVVELADAPGRVLAVGDLVTTRAGEATRSIIALRSTVERYATLFRSTAGAVAAAVMGTGMTVVSAVPLSPEK